MVEQSEERALRARQSMQVLSTSADVFETFFDHARIGYLTGTFSLSSRNK